MPEYLAPGVFIEETSFRSKSIEGVGTTTTGFVGPTRYGPIGPRLELVTSLVEFERTYGDSNRLFGPGERTHNYVWHAARAFFTEGGNKLYVSRIFRRSDDTSPGKTEPFNRDLDFKPPGEGYADGHARKVLGDPKLDDKGRPAKDAGPSALLRARWPGWAGNARVRVTFSAGPNILTFDEKKKPRLAGLTQGDLVLMAPAPKPPQVPPPPVPKRPEPGGDDEDGPPSPAGGGGEAPTGNLYVAAQDGTAWTFKGDDTKKAEELAGQTVQIVTATVAVTMEGVSGPTVWSGLALDPAHHSSGAKDALPVWFVWDPQDPASDADVPVVLEFFGAETGRDVVRALLAGEKEPEKALNQLKNTKELEKLAVEFTLAGGNDGRPPGAKQYEGSGSPRTGLAAFEDIDEIAMVAAPGCSANFRNRRDDAETILHALVAHVEKMRYRVAILDSGDGQTVSDVKEMRGHFDSTHAALYYPWVRIEDPVTQNMIMLPPSGFLAGIYARNDITRGVHKAPANEVLRLSSGFEAVVNTQEQEILNPLGVNCLRFFEGRGYRVWGARTISSDPEWKYVNVRRYFAYLEHSIDKGTQWAVFEPNGPLLWANVRRTIEDFLFNEFQNGALLGDRPEQSYFVKCDRSTMTQNDLDNGRLVCLIGVSPLKPAEFVIFRIGQWTADRKV